MYLIYKKEDCDFNLRLRESNKGFMYKLSFTFIL